MNFTKLSNVAQNKKEKKSQYYQRALLNLRENHRENDYIISKGDMITMQTVKYWCLSEYYSALEQIIKDNEKAQLEANKIKQDGGNKRRI